MRKGIALCVDQLSPFQVSPLLGDPVKRGRPPCPGALARDGMPEQKSTAVVALQKLANNEAGHVAIRAAGAIAPLV